MKSYIDRINEFVDEICRLIPDSTENTRHRIFQCIRSNLKVISTTQEVSGWVLGRSKIDIEKEIEYSATRGIANKLIEEKCCLRDTEPSSIPAGIMEPRGKLYKYSLVYLKEKP